MSPATAPHPVQRNTAEREIDNAIHRVYQKYGSDLGAFFRDARPLAENAPVTSVPLQSIAASKKRVKPA